MAVGLVVPVLVNFEGFTMLMHSVDEPVQPFVIPNWDKNIGVSGGWNDGIRRAIDAGCDHALVCNDDITLFPGTIAKLRESVQEYDMVTAINTRDGGQTDEPQFPEGPDFSCFMIKPAEFVEKFGWFDEEFFPAYFEDNDMHYRIRVAGGVAVCRTDAKMHHAGSVTQNWGGSPKVTSRMFEDNRAYYASKWGGVPGNEKYTTPFGE
jgi:GT2 family glycosyltransferase